VAKRIRAALEADTLRREIEEMEASIAGMENALVDNGAPDMTWLAEACHDVDGFYRRYRRLCQLSSSSAATSFARQEHRRLFGEYPEPETPIAIVTSRIGYKLQYDGYKSMGKTSELSDKFLQNYKAAMRLDASVGGYTSDMSSLLNVLAKAEQSYKTPTTSSTQRGNSRAGSASAYLYGVFWNNNETRLSDEKIQEMVHEKFGTNCYQRLSHVSWVRHRLNKGLVKSYGKPTTPILRFDDEGRVITGRVRPRRKTKRRVRRLTSKVDLQQSIEEMEAQLQVLELDLTDD